MSIHRTHSARNQSGPMARPFSSNNPFRNASYDSNIGNGGDAGFQNWVQRNQSQMSFSSDDEEGDLFHPGPAVAQATGSLDSLSMPPPRSTDSSALPVSRTSTGSRNSNGQSNELPTYPRNTSTDHYNSDEKIRPSAQTESDLPPSYEDVAGLRSARKDYPREKQTSNSLSQQYIEDHKTRQHREWPGDGSMKEGRTSSRSGTHRSRRPSEPGASSSSRHRSSREHRSDRGHREHRSDKERRSHRSKKEKTIKPAKNVDTIDKLDVTGLFGGAFHHDGPFDACTPHRNKDQKSAPVLAFPADGPNNSIRGTGPVSKDATLRYIQGRQDEDDDLYTTSVSGGNYKYSRGANGSESTLAAVKNDVNIMAFDTNVKATPVHGETTLGLGSSTFLDGAPAAKSAIEEANKAGLNRKKSIRQRLTGTSPPSQSARLNPPTAAPGSLQRSQSPEKLNVEGGGGNSLLKRVKSLKVGRSRS